MVIPSALTIPLDQWVCASAHPARLNILLQSCGSSQNDYSHLNIDDALPLLSHACKTSFGDLTALEFGVKVTQSPLAYSANLTITGPDEIGIEFPDSGKHPTQELAKMHAAYKAILGGAVGYITQSACPAATDLNEAPAHVPPSLEDPIDYLLKTEPADTTQDATPAAKQGKKPRATKPKAPPDALNLINTFLQRVYRDHNTPMPKSSREWKVIFSGGGVTARLTIKLPSGRSRSYGELPGMLSKPGKELKFYRSTAAAKREVASDALRAGVLQFIKFDKREETQSPSPTTTTVCAHNPLSTYVAYDPVKAPRITGANSAPLSGVIRTLAHGLPLRPSFLGHEETTTAPGPVPPLEQVIDRDEATPTRDTPHVDQSLSPVGEAEAVDELLGPGSSSNLESSEQEDEGEADELASSICENDRHLSEGRSESMELESDTGSPPKEIAVTDLGNRVSFPREEPDAVDEPPQKRQRTERPESPILETKQELDHEEPRVMLGASYSIILSDFCFERGHAQPKVTYQRNFKHPKAEGPVMYSVSICLGTSRFELSKQYENIELAEEKLSKRILRQFGVRAKRI